jgi:hypothetical protein
MIGHHISMESLVAVDSMDIYRKEQNGKDDV